MIHGTWKQWTGIVACSAALWANFTAAADGAENARVSFAQKSAMVRGANDTDWSYADVNSPIVAGDTIWADEASAAEIEFTEGAFVRLADGSKMDVASVPPDAKFIGGTGSFYVQRAGSSRGTLTFKTPTASIDVAPGAKIRVDIVDGGATTVTVRSGMASVQGDGGQPIDLRESERSYIDSGYAPSEAASFDATKSDSFDGWDGARDATLAEEGTASALTKAAPADAEPLIGSADLNAAGEWVSVDGEQYWHPTVVADFVPYQRGYWSYVPAQGYVWVDSYPWAYCTTHYGYWTMHARYGWIWSCNYHYAPAYCYTAHYGDMFVWAPMDRHGYPCRTTAGASFRIGDVSFGFGVTTFARESEVRGGCHIGHPVERVHIYDSMNRLRFKECTNWDIHSANSRYRSVVHAQHGLLSAERCAPTRCYRGMTTTTRFTTPARDRVAQLQAIRPVAKNSAKVGGSSAMSRTPVQFAQRKASVRPVDKLGRPEKWNIVGRPAPKTAPIAKQTTQHASTPEHGNRHTLPASKKPAGDTTKTTPANQVKRVAHTPERGNGPIERRSGTKAVQSDTQKATKPVATAKAPVIQKTTTPNKSLVTRQSRVPSTAERKPSGQNPVQKSVSAAPKNSSRPQAAGKTNRQAGARKPEPLKSAQTPAPRKQASAPREAPAQRKQAMTPRVQAPQQQTPARRAQAPVQRQQTPALRKDSPARPQSAPHPSAPVHQQQTSRQTAPVRQQQAPAVRTPAPVVHTPAPVVHTPAPVVHAPAPVVHTPAPVVHTPAPVIHTPSPAMNVGSRMHR